jgi:hypothetical protein
LFCKINHFQGNGPSPESPLVKCGFQLEEKDYFWQEFTSMLSKKTQYAIVALVRLGRQYQQGPMLISTIASEERIPKKFLEVILLELKNFGIVSSKKGKEGGTT